MENYRNFSIASYMSAYYADQVTAAQLREAMETYLRVIPLKKVYVENHRATTAYGFNRADASYIPGGVISGTALIRPDFPELKEWLYLWQQTEYVLGGGSTRFLFLVLAVRDLMAAAAKEEEENHG